MAARYLSYLPGITGLRSFSLSVPSNILSFSRGPLSYSKNDIVFTNGKHSYISLYPFLTGIEFPTRVDKNQRL